MKARARQRGFTLIELMVSLVVASLLVGMLLTIFTRMSFAYREQQQVIQIQQVLSAARTSLTSDAQQAGLAMAQGFTVSSDLGANRHSPLVVTNHADAADEVAFFYADPSAQALVVAGPPAPTTTQVIVDDATGFAAGDLVVLSTPDVTSVPNPLGENDASLAQFTACVVQVSAIAGTQVSFAVAGEWGNAGNVHCATPVAGTTMLYKFVAHAWRIDPDRADLGVLQLDRTGGLAQTRTWEDQAYGFTDLQAATYFFDGDATDTDDPDADPLRDWESSDEQTELTAPRAVGLQFAPPLMMTLSLVARTTSKVEGIASSHTPQLVDPDHVDHNLLGDHASASIADRRIYRYLTFQIDFRNLGVGR